MEKGQATRERILDHAFRMAARVGLEGMSLALLARDLGLSKSGLFAHFRSKEELQIGALASAAASFADAVVKPALKKPRGLPRVRALFDNWLRWANDPSLPGGCLFMAAAIELDDRQGPVRTYLVTAENEFLQMLARSARVAVEEGHFRRDIDCDQYAFEVHALVLGYNHARRLLREAKAEKRARAAFERLLQFYSSTN